MKISALDACVIAISGLAVVFVVLVVICLIIVIISKVLAADKKENTVMPVPEASEKTAYGGEVALIGVDEKTAACIMAIVSHETGIPLSELVFKKIKAL